MNKGFLHNKNGGNERALYNASPAGNRPDTAEYTTYNERYVSLVSGADIIESLDRQPSSRVTRYITEKSCTPGTSSADDGPNTPDIPRPQLK